MTAKEEAIELIKKFYSIGAIECKKCALIAVDELIKECWDHREIDLQAGYDYWISVKQEIEKL